MTTFNNYTVIIKRTKDSQYIKQYINNIITYSMKKSYLAPKTDSLVLDAEDNVMQVVSKLGAYINIAGDPSSPDLSIESVTEESDWVY